MAGGERGQWPPHFDEVQKIGVVNRTRNDAARGILQQISSDNPFEQAPQLESATYLGVGKIARMPQDVDHVLHTIIAIRDVSFWFGINKSFEELKREVAGMQEVPKSVTVANDDRQIGYEFQMRDAIDNALRSVMRKPEDFPDQNTRDVIQEYLQTREAARTVA